ncbi:MAG: twin-arginine translocation signal domain-containing protein, partial [Phycisphaerae bacterium]|nr:twin-arginine translocation signal domain-containing protein [Phycisphaerae bacterium]
MQDPSMQEPFVPGNGHSVDRRTFLRTTAVGIGAVAASAAIVHGEEGKKEKEAKADGHKEGGASAAS